MPNSGTTAHAVAISSGKMPRVDLFPYLIMGINLCRKVHCFPFLDWRDCSRLDSRTAEASRCTLANNLVQFTPIKPNGIIPNGAMDKRQQSGKQKSKCILLIISPPF
jgi:hypothetical protein